jgi:hypothetical protein
MTPSLLFMAFSCKHLDLAIPVRAGLDMIFENS